MNKIVIFSFFVLFTINCATGGLDEKDPVKSYDYASKPFIGGNYEIAIERLSKYRARFPYAKQIAEVDLMIADAHFKSEQFDEAAFEYSQFAKLRPNHAKVPYALYQLGECFWLDAPDDNDREQAFTQKAIVEWQRLIKQFPNNEYTKKSQEKISLGKRRIADHMKFIGDYYCKMKIYHSCASRFLDLVKKYPQYADLVQHSHKKSAFALEKLLAEKKNKNLKNDANLFFKNMSDEQLRAKIADIKSKIVR